jgi:MerR family Zn(II)-responsive transcriptional regulator of zntA
MPGNHQIGTLRIGELAARVGATADTVRYYEKLGLLESISRSESGYRLYSQAELGRLQFIRRAKLLGLSLDEIRSLLGVAEEGKCRPLRSQVAELLRRKIEACEAKLAELNGFKASLEERYQLALENQDEPACDCATFPANCACLPVQIEEVTPTTTPIIKRNRQRHAKEATMDAATTVTTRENLPPESTELQVINAGCGCGCGCDGTCGCGSIQMEARAERS